MTETDDRNQPDEPHATNGIDDALPVAPQRTIGLGVDPEQMIRSDADARVILAMWVIRKSWLPLVVIGITVATIFITTQGRDINELEAQIVEVGEGRGLLNALLTPLGLAAFGSLMRIATFPLAWAAAYPLAHLETKDRHTDSNWLGKRLRLTQDRIQLTRGYASIRAPALQDVRQARRCPSLCRQRGRRPSPW